MVTSVGYSTDHTHRRQTAPRLYSFGSHVDQFRCGCCLRSSVSVCAAKSLHRSCAAPRRHPPPRLRGGSTARADVRTSATRLVGRKSSNQTRPNEHTPAHSSRTMPTHTASRPYRDCQFRCDRAAFFHTLRGWADARARAAAACERDPSRRPRKWRGEV
jgi:hypothetical protein